MRRLANERFRLRVFGHYRARGRHNLPWRPTRNPYQIFVSELMLQQTQISRVLPKYQEWLWIFPNWRAVAKAPFPKVLRAWHGLGYNRRARYLKESAKIAVEKYHGRLPSDSFELEKFPGIGHYSARAIACFAFDRCEPFIETNIRRAIIHEFFPKQRTRISDKEILSILGRLEPRAKKREWYWALMDYGNEISRNQKENSNTRSKLYVRQSRFEGSRRYARARIVQALITAGVSSEAELVRTFRSDRHMKRCLEVGVFRGLLRSLEKDEILVYNNRQWMIRKT